jgi:hypothetical protein
MRFVIGTTVQDHNIDSVLVFATKDATKGFSLSRVQVNGQIGGGPESKFNSMQIIKKVGQELISKVKDLKESVFQNEIGASKT